MMKSHLFAGASLARVGLLLACGMGMLSSWCQAEDAAAEKLFHEQVAPILVKNCLECHNTNTRKGNLSLETLADTLQGGDEGSSVVVGKPDDSPLYQKIVPAAAGDVPEMPKKKAPLTEAEQQLVRQWIEQGAVWPKSMVLKEKSKADKSFWSFVPLTVIEPPVTKEAPADWQNNPVDEFIVASLHAKGLKPNPRAGARQLIRRATFDLWGLPPTPEEIASFETEYGANPQQAMEQLVERLLASPHYGERWGRHWLDVVRFGESRGYERNEIIYTLWPFRDYVIDSFNSDKPMNRLIQEHLAGDMLAPNDPQMHIASAFLVAGPYDDVGNQDPAAAAQIRSDQMDEMVRATGEGFLGMTLGCARCHDHKFDPLKAADYYAMASAFAGVVHGEREVGAPEQFEARAKALAPLQEQLKLAQEKQQVLVAKKANPQTPLTAEEEAEHKTLEVQLAAINKQIAEVPGIPRWWVGNHRAAPGPFHVYLGGSAQKHGEEVQTSSLSALEGVISGFRLENAAEEGNRRLELAKWITADDHPLSRRVLANRIWHYHFGCGIVDTPSDFGYMGGRPSHPELLDWLAAQLSTGNWQLKSLHRLIMTSQTYQQSADYREEAARVDGDSRLLWRFPPRRLASEEVRDTMLFVSGKLNMAMGGPGFKLYEYQQDNVATYVPLDVHGPETYRRAVYHHNARASRVDLLTDFDAPDPTTAEPRRAATTTPLQALTLMNHSFSLDMAKFFAQRVQEEVKEDVPQQIDRVFVLAYGRKPSEEERQAGIELVKKHGLVILCRAVLNSNELIMID